MNLLSSNKKIIFKTNKLLTKDFETPILYLIILNNKQI